MSTAGATLESRLQAVYKEHGLRTFLDVCSNMLKVDSHGDIAKKKRFNGAVCEVVLCTMTRHYLLRRKRSGEVFHSVVLRDKSNLQSEFRTELDFILMHPSICLTGECKSFVGDIIVSNECLLTRDNLTADVNRQSQLHGKYLELYLRDFVKTGAGIPRPPYKLFCFVYCRGTIRDARSLEAKEALPVLTVSTLFTYYDKLFSLGLPEVYNVRKATTAFTEGVQSEELRQEHRKFLGY